MAQYRDHYTSLAEMALMWDAPMILVSAPEKGKALADPPGSQCTAKVMDTIENLPQLLREELHGCFAVAFDFAGGESAELCYDPTHSFKTREDIEASKWFCFWYGKVQGALSQASQDTVGVALPEFNGENCNSTCIPDVKLGGQTFPFINGFVGKGNYKVVIMISIDGGPITQVEKANIPRIISGTKADLFRRGLPSSWTIWIHFPTIEDMANSMGGVRNLTHDWDSAYKGSDSLNNWPKKIGYETQWKNKGYPLTFTVASRFDFASVPVSLFRSPVEDVIAAELDHNRGLADVIGLGNVKALEYLLDRRADPSCNCYGKSGCGVMQVAMGNGSNEIVDVLFKRGFEANKYDGYVDIYGYNLLGRAVTLDHPHGLDKLLKAKALPEFIANEFKALPGGALQYAKDNGYDESARILQELVDSEGSAVKLGGSAGGGYGGK